MIGGVAERLKVALSKSVVRAIAPWVRIPPLLHINMKITIFGLAGSGTSTVGKQFATDLGYTYVSSGDMMRAKAKEQGLTLEQYHELCMADSKYDCELDDELKKFGEENNNFVVESRLAWHFIPDSIKIKLVTDFKVRVKRLAERDGLSFKDAEKHVIAREKTDDSRYKKFYGIENINDGNHYDFVVETSTITPEQIVKQIISFINKNQS